MAVRLSALHTGCPLPQGIFLILISVRGSVDPRAIVRMERWGQLKNPMTSSGIETTTFQLVALVSFFESLGKRILEYRLLSV
jgi:hypothetical protein